jgi:hypothetical protein
MNKKWRCLENFRLLNPIRACVRDLGELKVPVKYFGFGVYDWCDKVLKLSGSSCQLCK